MAELRFIPRAKYSKTLTRPLAFYASHCLLAGATAEIPFFVTTLELAKMKPSGGNPGSTLGTVAGLTSVESFSVSFDDVNQQWKKASTGAAKPFWQFQGGPIYLDMVLTVRVDQRFKPRTDIVDVIMEHELLHVADDLDVLTNTLPKKILEDPLLREYFVDRKSVDDSMFQYWFRGTKFSEYVAAIFAEEHNKRGNARDTGTQYNNYQNRIVTLENSAPKKP